jgi:hypothetical protein
MAADAVAGWLILAPIAVGVAMMARGRSQALVMPMVATAILVLKGTDALKLLQSSFADFAVVAITFTAIAIPAQQLRRSGLFRLSGAAESRRSSPPRCSSPGCSPRFSTTSPRSWS